MQDVILHGDCLELLRGLEANSVDACVTDPPYGLGEVKDMAGLLQAWLHDKDDSAYIGKSGFMGKEWDAGVPSPRYWREVYRVLKPGAHVLCFAGTRTQDLMSLSLRLAGFECRDTLAWCYGSGFPKSHAIDKAIDKLLGAEREVIGKASGARNGNGSNNDYGTFRSAPDGLYSVTAPATPDAKRWQGFGSALKPAHEPILLFRKPLSAANLASNVLAWGTGGLNIAATRVQLAGIENHRTVGAHQSSGASINPYFTRKNQQERAEQGLNPRYDSAGRWPPNFLLSHSADCSPAGCSDDCPVAALDEQAGEHKGGNATDYNREPGSNQDNTVKFTGTNWKSGVHYGDDSVNVSRFFPVFDMPAAYFPKASRRERNAGCEALPVKVGRPLGISQWEGQTNGSGETMGPSAPQSNHHPTVKSLALMSWLVRLITPPNGTVLDCFAGSGSTLVACVQEGFHFIGMEQSEEYCQIARARVAHAQREQKPAKPRAKITRLPKRPKEVEQLAMFA